MTYFTKDNHPYSSLPAIFVVQGLEVVRFETKDLVHVGGLLTGVGIVEQVMDVFGEESNAYRELLEQTTRRRDAAKAVLEMCESDLEKVEKVCEGKI